MYVDYKVTHKLRFVTYVHRRSLTKKHNVIKDKEKPIQFVLRRISFTY